MPLASLSQNAPVEYYMLHDPVPSGPVIGFYRGSEIRAYVSDVWGALYRYAGIAPRLRNGAFDVAALRPREFIVETGLVYRHCGR